MLNIDIKTHYRSAQARAAIKIEKELFDGIMQSFLKALQRMPHYLYGSIINGYNYEHDQMINNNIKTCSHSSQIKLVSIDRMFFLLGD